VAARQRSWLIGSLAAFVLAMVSPYLCSHSPAGEAVGTEPTVTQPTVPTTLTAAQSWNYPGDTKTVRFQVAYTGSDSQGDEFLDPKQDDTTGLVAVVFGENVASFGSHPIALYGGQTFAMTGKTSSYDGHPQIIVSSPSQIVLSTNG
jgi:hypothetical protein